MEKKDFLTAGLISVLVIGLAFAASAAVEDIGKQGRFGEMFGGATAKTNLSLKEMRKEGMAELGLSENATHEEIRDAMWSKRLEDLGLTEESTLAELKNAMRLKHEEQLSELKEELGLSDDATSEDVREALNENSGTGLGMRKMGGRHGSMDMLGV